MKSPLPIETNRQDATVVMQLVQLPTVSRSLNGRFFLSLFDVTWGLLNQQLVSNLFICMKGSAVLKNLHDSPLITFNYGVLGKDPRCHID